MSIPFTYKEQRLLIFLNERGSSGFKDQDVFSNRGAFNRAMRRLSMRNPGIIKIKKVYLNGDKTQYRNEYRLTMDGRWLTKSYIIPGLE